jgi:hypothetical protein
MPIIIAGTIEECAKTLGIKVESFKQMSSRQRHGLPVGNRKRSIIIIRDGKLEDED